MTTGRKLLRRNARFARKIFSSLGGKVCRVEGQEQIGFLHLAGWPGAIIGDVLQPRVGLVGPVWEMLAAAGRVPQVCWGALGALGVGIRRHSALPPAPRLPLRALVMLASGKLLRALFTSSCAQGVTTRHVPWTTYSRFWPGICQCVAVSCQKSPNVIIPPPPLPITDAEVPANPPIYPTCYRVGKAAGAARSH